MKKISLVGFVALILSTGVGAEENSENTSVYKVETSESQVHWTGKKVTGEHTGTLSLGDGEINFDGDKIVGANIKMDMTSIVCIDLKDESSNSRLVGHLRSDDFFSVEKYPESVFVASKFEVNQDATLKEGNYIVTGDLTIKGITNEISFPVNVEVNDTVLSVNGTANIDRTKWDIRYGSGSFFQGLGDNLIYDTFEIEFDLSASREITNL